MRYLKNKIILIFIFILVFIGLYFGYQKYEEKKWSDCFEWLLSIEQTDEIPKMVKPGDRCFDTWKDFNQLFNEEKKATDEAVIK